MTTNESGKWADLREDIAEGRVWRARLEELGADFPGLDAQPLAEGGGRGRGDRLADPRELGGGHHGGGGPQAEGAEEGEKATQ